MVAGGGVFCHKWLLLKPPRQGRFQGFGQGGARWRAKRAEKFWHPPAGGCQPLIHKHLNRGLTYGLLIVIYIYISSSQDISLPFDKNIAHIHLNFHLKEHLSNRLSLNCLWFDPIPLSLPFLSMCKRNLCTYYDNLKYDQKLNH